jgi:hypothetical protein
MLRIAAQQFRCFIPGYLGERCPARCALWRASQRWPPLQLVRISIANSSLLLRVGGAYRDRTDDLMLAKQPLSQLS